MATNFEPSLHSDLPIAPGVLLEEELAAAGITAQQLALNTGMSEQMVAKILRGEVPITDKRALELERVLGIPASLWLNLEARYQAARAREALLRP